MINCCLKQNGHCEPLHVARNDRVCFRRISIYRTNIPNRQGVKPLKTEIFVLLYKVFDRS